VYGPVEGRRHDITMLKEFGIERSLSESLLINGEQYYIYGDLAYILRPYIQVGFQGPNLTTEQASFNSSKSLVRIAVEWAFKDTKQCFIHLVLPRKLNVRMTPVGVWY
jgi:hypothetical protein